MSVLFLDTETRSAVPISRGTDRYTRSAQCLLLTYALDAKPVQAWEPWDQPTMPRDLSDYLADERVTLVAHNAAFDRNVLRFGLRYPTPVERWWCTMAQAYAHGLPGGLELLGIVLELPQDERKLVEDGKLLHTFCIPYEGDKFINPWDRPEDWARFRGYGIRDTDALRSIYRRLPTHNYQGEHRSNWHLDQLINQRGFGFDSELARACVSFLDDAKNVVDGELSTVTEMAVTAATQRQRLLDYINAHYDIDLPNLRASEIRHWLEHDDLDPMLRFLLETRLEAGKSSGSKYKRGIGALGPGNRLRFGIQWNGAGRTGRGSGRIFQPHNMARPQLTVRKEFGPDAGKVKLIPVKAKYIDEVIIPGIYSKRALSFKEVYGGPYEATALALRHVIVPAKGNELVVADWSNIESRVLAWLADESWKLDAYRAVDRGEGVDLYKLLFSQFFGVPIDKINDTERQSGKVSELAFGFGGGVGALVTMAAGYQMDLAPLADLVLPRATEEQLQKAHKMWRRAFLMNEDYGLDAAVYKACDVLKQTYRGTNAKIDDLKHAVERAVKDSIRDPGGPVRHVGKCSVWSTGSWLIIQLPSGRRLLYCRPKIEVDIDIDVDTLKPVHREFISYATARARRWRRERAWSGLFVENIVQAVAHDILRAAQARLHADTLSVPQIAAYLSTLDPEERTAIALHVHDELVLDVPIGSYALKRMIGVMVQETSWSRGLPLAAEGWVGPRYGKR